MNCAPQLYSVIAATVLSIATVGCGESSTPMESSSAPRRLDSIDKQQFIDTISQAERESQSSETPDPVIDLATPPGWTKSELQPLPTDDHGFTVAYEHHTGLGVTFYQYTRGLAVIPNDLTARPAKDELDRAKSEIEHVVELGYWQSAEEKTNDTVTLGDSRQQALWSQYELTLDGATLVSDIYVWVHSNAFLKLRCTCRSEEISNYQAVLDPLLTSLGRGSKPANE